MIIKNISNPLMGKLNTNHVCVALKLIAAKNRVRKAKASP